MMSMLVRAGLPSRQAARTAVREGNGLFLDGSEMRKWLEGDEIGALTDTGEWPTPETAALWKRFRDEVLSGGIAKWYAQESKRTLDLQGGGIEPPVGVYRIEVDAAAGDVWICSPDYRRLARLKRRIKDRSPSLFTARIVEGDNRAHIERFGRGRAFWLE
jgi:hypothetical protein